MKELPRAVDELEGGLWPGSDMCVDDVIGIAHVLIPVHAEDGEAGGDMRRARCCEIREDLTQNTSRRVLH
jgi:hypothetical protein